MDFNNSDNRTGGGMPMQGNPNMGSMPMQGNPNMNGMPMPGNPNMNGMPMQGNPNMGRMTMQGNPNMNGMPMPGNPNMGRMPMPGGPNMGRIPMQGNPNMNGMTGRGTGFHSTNGNGASDASEKLARMLENNLNNDNNSRVRSRNQLPPEDSKVPPRRVFGKDEADSRQHQRWFGDNQEGFSINPPTDMMGAVSNFAIPIFVGILVICLAITLIAYSMSDKTKVSNKKTENKTMDLTAVTGIIPVLYENRNNASSMTNTNGTDPTDPDDFIPSTPSAEGDETGVAGTITSSSTTSTSTATSGATMIIDSGAGTAGYNQAGSFEELITQLESAIASGDTEFVGTKLAYENENGELCGYPQSVVDYFVSYMSVNSDKRSTFMQEINSDKYSVQNGSAYVIKLPQIKFVVNMGYDNTTISLSGFSDQLVNAGQSAEITPLLPCMYTLTISNPDWTEDVTRDIEANVNETTLSINIKP